MAGSVRALPRERGGDGVPVVSLSPPKKRRLSWAAVGALLLGVAALLGAYVFSVVDDRLSVLVAAHDLEPGEPVTDADLRVVEMGRTGGLRAIQPDQQDLIIGQAPRGPIPAGTVLNTGLFVSQDSAIPAGQVVVGGAFEAGAVPTATLGPGDQVVLLLVAAPSAGSAPVDGQASVLGTARVWAVEGSAAADSSAAKVWVSLLIDEGLQTSVVQAAADARLRLGLAGG